MTMKNILKIKMFIMKQYLRYTFAGAVMNLINFSLLVIALSPNISGLIGISEKYVIFIVIPISFGVMWFIGYIMDKMKYRQGIIITDTKRNPPMLEVMARCRNIEGKIIKIEKMMKEMKNK